MGTLLEREEVSYTATKPEDPMNLTAADIRNIIRGENVKLLEALEQASLQKAERLSLFHDTVEITSLRNRATVYKDAAQALKSTKD